MLERIKQRIGSAVLASDDPQRKRRWWEWLLELFPH
jgi:hypothetical protein